MSAWRRRQAGSYVLDTDHGVYYLQNDPDVGGWTVLYPDGELSESADTLREAKRWAESDAAR